MLLLRLAILGVRIRLLSVAGLSHDGGTALPCLLLLAGLLLLRLTGLLGVGRTTVSGRLVHAGERTLTPSALVHENMLFFAGTSTPWRGAGSGVAEPAPAKKPPNVRISGSASSPGELAGGAAMAGQVRS